MHIQTLCVCVYMYVITSKTAKHSSKQSNVMGGVWIIIIQSPTYNNSHTFKWIHKI